MSGRTMNQERRRLAVAAATTIIFAAGSCTASRSAVAQSSAPIRPEPGSSPPVSAPSSPPPGTTPSGAPSSAPTTTADPLALARSRTAAEIFELEQAIRRYYVFTGSWPKGQDSLLKPPMGAPPVLLGVAKDAWGVPLLFDATSAHLEIRSAGPDSSVSVDDLVYNVEWQAEPCGSIVPRVTSDPSQFVLEDDPFTDLAVGGADVMKIQIDMDTRKVGMTGFLDFLEANESARCGQPRGGEAWRELPLYSNYQTGRQKRSDAARAAIRQRWTGACTEIAALRATACDDETGACETGVCEANRRGMVKKRPLLWVAPTPHVRYDAVTRRYTVTAKRALQAVGEFDFSECGGDVCSGSLVSTRPLRLSGATGNFYVWAGRLNTALTPLLAPELSFTVDARELDDPMAFESQLIIEALVEPVDAQVVSVGEWFYYDNLQVRLVSARAFLLDFSWGRVIKDGHISDKRLACPIAELRSSSDDESAESSDADDGRVLWGNRSDFWIAFADCPALASTPRKSAAELTGPPSGYIEAGWTWFEGCAPKDDSSRR